MRETKKIRVFPAARGGERKEILSVRLCRGDAAKRQAAEVLHVPFEEDESKRWGHLDTCGARKIAMGRNYSRLLPIPAMRIPGDRLNTEYKIAQPRLRRAHDNADVQREGW